jgi:branched-chain amino acid transport system permease protein
LGAAKPAPALSAELQELGPEMPHPASTEGRAASGAIKMSPLLVKLWQALISGLSIGSIYALIAEGYYITYVTTGALNFGQGEFLMIGALFGLTCYVTLGLPYAIAVIAAVLLTGLMGIGLERIAIRPVMRHALSLSWVLSTVAISIILKNAAMNIWGPEQIKFPSPFGEGVVQIGSAGIFPQELLIIVAALGTVFAVQVFLRRSLLGKALIAVAFNRNAAAVVGINVPRMVVLAFVLSSALAGLGGILVAPVTFAWAYMGTVPGIKAFAAAIFGGLENPVGILVGGLLIGLLEQLFGIVNSNLKEGITFFFILIVLAIRPTGLMGSKEITKV